MKESLAEHIKALEAEFFANLRCHCWKCGRLADTAALYAEYELQSWDEHPDSLYRFCKSAAEKVAGIGWTMKDERPYCPECS
jgi:hypothetical protein